jgi:hypothetical protein
MLMLGTMSSSAISTLDRMNANEIAGHSVRVTSRRLHGEAGGRALIAGMLLVAGLAIGAGGGGGVGAILIGAALFTGLTARQRARSARRFAVGAVAEERVGSRLWVLEDRGWLVEQDVQKRSGGNIDHVVHSPAVTFVIDTKASRCRSRDIAQAHRHAEWGALHYGGAREILAIVCVQGSGEPGREVDEVVSVVGASRLVDFLLERG